MVRPQFGHEENLKDCHQVDCYSQGDGSCYAIFDPGEDSVTQFKTALDLYFRFVNQGITEAISSTTLTPESFKPVRELIQKYVELSKKIVEESMKKNTDPSNNIKEFRNQSYDIQKTALEKMEPLLKRWKVSFIDNTWSEKEKWLYFNN